jgi:ATP-dependent RNA helicase DeaD
LLKHHSKEYNVLTVYGGVSLDDQMYALRRGVDIFVGTTGRILDHMERKNFDFSQLKSIALDEAD